MICVDAEPFSVVERPGFRRLMNITAPGYIMRDRKFYSNKWLDDTYNRMCGVVKDDLAGIDNISMTTDIWTCEHTKDGYLSLTGHYAKPENSDVRSSCLAVCPFNERHTGLNISKSLTSTVKIWDVQDKVHLFVRDSGANMVSGLNKSGFDHVSCGAHTLELVVNPAVLKQEKVNEMMNEIRTEVKYYKQSGVAAKALEQEQLKDGISVPLKLVQDVLTRWGSSYDMLERAIKLKKYILMTNISLDRSSNITPTQWKLAEKVRDVLGVFHEATLKLEGDAAQSPISVTIPVINMLLNAVRCEESDPDIVDMQEQLEMGLLTRFKDLECDHRYSIATLLDPRYKDQYFMRTQTAEKTKLKLFDLYEEMVDDKPLSGFKRKPSSPPQEQPSAKRVKLSDFAPNKKVPKKSVEDDIKATFTNTLNAYLDEDLESDDYKPLEYWCNHKDINLSKLAYKFLSTPASSASSERVFSKANNILTSRRSRMNPDKVEKLLFLGDNLTRYDYKY